MSVLLDETRARIAAVETEERVRADTARHLPPVVEWVIEYGIDAAGRSIVVHTGDWPPAAPTRPPAPRRSRHCGTRTRLRDLPAQAPGGRCAEGGDAHAPGHVGQRPRLHGAGEVRPCSVQPFTGGRSPAPRA
ncbi:MULTISPECIES: hypothetical protein [unclassified Streptomyces]|uniref:hypothetical protein n=1 Tax=unclassified Streptomyces TaxID=2593676 RepID=UPI003331F324